MVSKYGLLGKKFKFETLFKLRRSRIIFLASTGIQEININVACIGNLACLNNHYWARLAGVRVLTEIYVPRAPLYPILAAMPNRDQVVDLLRRQGDKALIGYFPSGIRTGKDSASAGWQQLDGCHLYAYPLNLPAAPPQKLSK